MKSPYQIILRPIITEKSVALSYGDVRVREDDDQVHTYTFEVAPDANKIEIKAALEAIYNEGKKGKDDKIEVTRVRTLILKGKSRRVGHSRPKGKRPDRKKAMITLARGQILEDYGV
ncbi:MAG TPA: 50S ribosomal protein L23 [Fimbriimonadaceae bacterium]|nr:50S ribosomal protein L23 [Fimbriimonadaceae bacterium]